MTSRDNGKDGKEAWELEIVQADGSLPESESIFISFPFARNVFCSLVWESLCG